MELNGARASKTEGGVDCSQVFKAKTEVGLDCTMLATTVKKILKIQALPCMQGSFWTVLGTVFTCIPDAFLKFHAGLAKGWGTN